MIINAINGLCMAVADSVPGVSGGTVAFILGFYDRFIDALHYLFHGTRKEKLRAFKYLVNMGVGWCIGMISCVLLLSRLFEKNIYLMSSVFLGLTLASIPFVIAAEKKNLSLRPADIAFAVAGCAVVVAMTLLRSSTGSIGNLDFLALQPLHYIYIILCGMVAISVMVLPGISGSTVLLIAGIYIPTIEAVRKLSHMEIAVLPGILALGAGVVLGVFVSVPLIRTALVRHRSKMVFFITGSMAGSLFSIIMAPVSLSAENPPLSFDTLVISAVLAGIAVLLAMEKLRVMTKKKENAAEKPEHVENEA